MCHGSHLSTSAVLVFLMALAGAPPASAAPDEDTRMTAVEHHAMALEALRPEGLEAQLDALERNHFAAGYLAASSRQQRLAVLTEVAQLASTAGGVMLEEQDGEVLLTLEGRQRSGVVAFRVAAATPHQITSLAVREPTSAPGLPTAMTWDSAAVVLEQLEEAGFAGVVHLSRNGRTLHEAAYGAAASTPGGIRPLRLDSIFGIGSTPIDFTVAAVYLLVVQGKVTLDEPLGNFFPAAAADGALRDKTGMTLRHLLTGQSGLPDFHHQPGVDWDHDLAWISRDEAVRRILAQPLLFAPGTDRAHSHSAYGLAAAIVELRSGQSYRDFLQQHLFRPAGMTRTGMYGERQDFSQSDFAVGGGPSLVGLPSIPPNWGPTSWLVLGSGGMYSTLGDMLRFYRYLRTPGVLPPRLAARFLGEGVGIGGSDRGFYLFHAYRSGAAEVLLLSNQDGRSPRLRALSRALEQLVMAQDR